MNKTKLTCSFGSALVAGLAAVGTSLGHANDLGVLAPLLATLLTGAGGWLAHWLADNCPRGKTPQAPPQAPEVAAAEAK
jgi:hypothetical protein